MLKKILIILGIVAIAAIEPAEAKRKTKKINTYYTYPVECISSELDGSITVRAWGNGRNRADAVEQACKQAVYAVIFKGVTVQGQAQSVSRPLILERNAEEKYQYFFNPFFADQGTYMQFVNKEDTRGGTNTRQKSKTQVKYGVTVRVLRSELKQYLIQNDIIKP